MYSYSSPYALARSLILLIVPYLFSLFILLLLILVSYRSPYLLNLPLIISVYPSESSSSLHCSLILSPILFFFVPLLLLVPLCSHSSANAFLHAFPLPFQLCKHCKRKAFVLSLSPEVKSFILSFVLSAIFGDIEMSSENVLRS